MRAAVQGLIRVILPPQCLACRETVAEDWALCPACWRETGFINGLVCDACGLPLPGEEPEGRAVLCDDCLRTPRPWARGRAVLLYGGAGRRLVLALKHADRLDIARPAGVWMARAAAPLLAPGMLVAPVPLHWLRLLRRRYNQAALLSAALARAAELEHCPDLLIRARRTGTMEGRGRAARFAAVAGAIRPHPRRGRRAEGRHVLLVDDVMTSGATLAAAAEACRAAGAAEVSVAVLARAAPSGPGEPSE